MRSPVERTEQRTIKTAYPTLRDHCLRHRRHRRQLLTLTRHLTRNPIRSQIPNRMLRGLMPRQRGLSLTGRRMARILTDRRTVRIPTGRTLTRMALKVRDTRRARDIQKDIRRVKDIQRDTRRAKVERAEKAAKVSRQNRLEANSQTVEKW